MRREDQELNIDVGIITIKPEEFSAVTSRLGKKNTINGYKHVYIHKSITDVYGHQNNIAVARCLEPGNGTAQALAADMVEELNPTWLFLVGIAGGFPAHEYSLGDVLLCTRLHDFSVSCTYEDNESEFADSGGPIHCKVAKLLEVLPSFEKDLDDRGWNELTRLRKARPFVDLNSPSFNNKLYGDESWKEKVIESLRDNFSDARKPKYYFGSTACSDQLVKSPSLLKIWQHSARDLKTVEMELAGVCRAAKNRNIPVLAIRSLSDIVGYKRSPEWTQFACECAASFAICLIKAGLLKIRTNIDDSLLGTKSVNLSVDNLTIQDDTYISLPIKSPFHPYGTIPLNDQSYVTREADERLKNLLNNNSFICLRGDYCSGKSSLLIRVQNMLPKDWIIFRPKIDLYPSVKGALEKNFFIELQNINMELKNWIFLDEFLEKAKMAFLIDEISKCHPKDAIRLIEELYSLVDYDSSNHDSSDHVRVVMTIPVELDTYLRNIKLNNPKYYDCWKNVELTNFNEKELRKMLDMFPQPVALSLKNSLNLIQKYTSMKPSKIQQFCDDLWKHLVGREIQIKEIDQEINYYLKECITL